MNKTISGLAAAAAVLLCGVRVYGAAVDGIAAVVNDGIITYSELEERLAPRARRGGEFFEKFAGEELNAIIEERLLSAKAAELGVAVPPGEVENELAKIKSRFPSEAEFRSSLDGQKLTESGLRGRLKANLLLAEIARVEILPGRPRPSMEEARLFYEENPGFFTEPRRLHLRRIFISHGEKRSARSAAGKIQEIENRISAGEDFSALAGEYSEGPEASAGGDLGFVSAAEFLPGPGAALSGLSPGEVSTVFRTEDGFSIFKLEGLKEGRRMEFSEVEDALLQYLFQADIEREAQNWLEKLKSDSFIDVRI